MQAAVTALGTYFQSLKNNGIVDIGLSAALDMGVTEKDYIQIPRSLLKPVSLSGDGLDPVDVHIVGNLPSGKRIAALDCIIVRSTEAGERYCYRGVEYTDHNCSTLSDREIANLVLANYKAGVRAGYTEQALDLVVAAHSMSVLMDDFVGLRLRGAPAGSRYLYVTLEACRRIAACGLLVQIPAPQVVKEVNLEVKEAVKAGPAAHIRAKYYARGTNIPTIDSNQNLDDFHALTICAGAFLHIVAPSSTLASSPAFSGSLDEAATMYPDWVTDVRVYASCLDDKKFTIVP